MANFSKEQIAEQCKIFGSQVMPLPTTIFGNQLLWAIAGCESSFGASCAPRHEPAYDVGGRYSGGSPMPELLEEYGSDAACSYGPWQVLLANASSYAPSDFDDLQLATQATVGFLNSLLRRFKPSTLSEIASCWNAGHIQDPLSPGVQRYADDLAKYYTEPFPA